MLQTLLEDLKQYKVKQTVRHWTKNELLVNFENDYIKVIRIDSSNKWTADKDAGYMSKMWSIIINIKQRFENLDNFKILQNHIDIRITPVMSGKLKGYFGIRIYNMRQEPDSNIILSILNFIFENKKKF